MFSRLEVIAKAFPAENYFVNDLVLFPESGLKHTVKGLSFRWPLLCKSVKSLQ